MYSERVMQRRFGGLVRLLAILIATVWLVGCGSPTTNGSTPATSAPSAISSIPSVGPDEQQQEDTNSLGSLIQEAIQSQIEREFTTPYRDVTVMIVNQDEAFATAEVRLFMRKSENDTWQEYVATYKMKNVRGQWQVAESGKFISALSPQMTATAQAEAESKTTIVSLQMLSDTEGWAVGNGHYGRTVDGSVLLKYDQPGGWNQVAYMPDYFLNDIFLESAVSGWAVGQKVDASGAGNSLESVILRFDGKTWKDVEHPSMQTLAAVAFTAPNQGWAVGDASSLDAREGILQFNGTEWRAVRIADPPENYDFRVNLLSISMASPTIGLAVGEVDILKLRSDGQFERVMTKQKGNNWGYNRPANGKILRQVYMVSADEAYAVGGTKLPEDKYAMSVLHYKDDHWSALEGWSDELMTAYDVYASSPQDLWIVGDSHDRADNKIHSAIVHYSASTGKWEDIQHPDIGGTLYTVRFVSPNEAWAAGSGGQILHYKDGAWSLYKR